MKKKNGLVLSIAAAVAAATSFYLVWRKKNARSGNTPPKGAPQLHLDNPGDQSEFPASSLDDRGIG